jgi:RNA polymerase sigma-70 factor (ECF subfamily)
VRRGDAGALSDLYRRHGDGLFRFLVRLSGDRMLAEEILQDTLLAVWRGAEFAGRSQVRTWLYGIARRQAHNRLRVVRPAEVPLDEAPVVAVPSAGDLALARLARDRVLAAIEALSLPQREVMLLVVSDLSQAEIAEVVGIPVGTVKSRLHHARAALLRLLAKEVPVEETRR